MKEFEIILIGDWIIEGIYEGKSKEEALEKALEDFIQKAFQYKILETYVNLEKINNPIIKN